MGSISLLLLHLRNGAATTNRSQYFGLFRALPRVILRITASESFCICRSHWLLMTMTRSSEVGRTDGASRTALWPVIGANKCAESSRSFGRWSDKSVSLAFFPHGLESNRARGNSTTGRRSLYSVAIQSQQRCGGAWHPTCKSVGGAVTVRAGEDA